MTKAGLLPKPYVIFRIRKTFTYVCCMLFIEFSQALLMPYERFVMLLKFKST